MERMKEKVKDFNAYELSGKMGLVVWHDHGLTA
jgi:hypothetical protein